MKKWPPDYFDDNWNSYSNSIDPAKVDEHRKDTYLSHEAFLRSTLGKLNEERPSRWNRNYSSPEAYEKSVAQMRSRLKKMLGFWQEPGERAPLRVWDYEPLIETDDFIARRFKIEVTPGLETYGISLAPRTTDPHPGLLAQHGYGGTPELVCGLAPSSGDPSFGYRSMGLRAVLRGFYVVAINHPSSYGTTSDSCGNPLPGFPNLPGAYGKNRLHRMATLARGTILGLELLASSRGIDLLKSLPEVDSKRIGMYGLSYGGLATLYLPALDTRIRASVCSAYFNTRIKKLIGPGHRGLTFLDSTEEDQFFRDVISCFSDSDIVSLIAPRAFAVEAGEKDPSIDFERSWDEFQFAKEHYEKLGSPDKIEFIAHELGHISTTRRALDFLVENL